MLRYNFSQKARDTIRRVRATLSRPNRSLRPELVSAAGDQPDGLAHAVVGLFTAEPLQAKRPERVARELGAEVVATSAVLDGLVELGLLERRRSPVGGGDVYQLLLADSFLEVLDKLSAFYNEQLDSIVLSPERAQLATGEREVELVSLRSLRARVANLEAINALLQRKNVELSFLYEMSALFGSSINPATLVQMVLDAVATASALQARRYFVAVLEDGVLDFAAGVGVNDDDGDAFMRQHAALLQRCVDNGEIIALPLTDGDAAGGGRCIALPMKSGPSSRGQGCIVITEVASEGLCNENLRSLIVVAELAGRGFANAALFSESVAIGSTDELTGTMNRRYLFRRLGEELKRARRLGENLSIIVLDVDHFKSVNDAHGHPEGDRVLKAVAKTLGSAVREIDVVTRLGGEEFAIILPAAALRNAVEIAERVRHAVESQRFQARDGRPIRLTVSCGVATLADDIHTPAHLVAAADRYLLEAKRAGRNRTMAKPARS